MLLVEQELPLAAAAPATTESPAGAWLPLFSPAAPACQPEGPSQRTSTVWPNNSRFKPLETRFCRRNKSLLRKRFTSSEISSSKRLMAIVPGRGEYLKMKQFL